MLHCTTLNTRNHSSYPTKPMFALAILSPPSPSYPFYCPGTTILLYPSLRSTLQSLHRDIKIFFFSHSPTDRHPCFLVSDSDHPNTVRRNLTQTPAFISLISGAEHLVTC